MLNKNLNKDQYYMNIAREVARKSKCYRRAMGAIIVRDDQIISTGYVGAIRKGKDCFEHGFCLRTRLGIPHGHRYELCRSVHAEQNAIINAARAGVSLLGGDIYIFGMDPVERKRVDILPCFICKKMIINAGLSRVICSTKTGGLRAFKTEDWTHEWQINDVIQDQDRYGKGQKVLSEKEIEETIARLHKQDFLIKDENEEKQKEASDRPLRGEAFGQGNTGRIFSEQTSSEGLPDVPSPG